MRAADRYHQGALLRQALFERGMAPERVEVDHINGRATVDGVPVGVVFPDRWFRLTAALIGKPKIMRFVFIGHVGPGRARLLEAFAARHSGVSVTATRKGRDPKNRGRYDEGYFAALASAEFGLCPNHTTWRGPRDTAWCYRLVECCMVGTIPVCFRAAPLSPSFTEGVRFRWDDEDRYAYSPEDAIHNRVVAETRFTLP